MKSLYGALLMLLLIVATLFLANCAGGAPGCPQVAFGGTACSPGGKGGFGGGGGGGGGGASKPAAYAYAVDEGGTIDGYVLNTSSGTFGPISGYTAPLVPTNSGGVGMVIAQQQYLYAGFGSTDQLYGWTISSSGTLSSISGSPFSAPFLGFYGTGVGQAEMITNPAGTLLFISDTLQSEIYAFQIGSGGVLTAVTGSPFALPAGFQPMNLATDGLGKYLYAINGAFTTHQGSEIAAFAIGTGSALGQLTAVTGSPFVYPMWQVEGEPTGQFLIGTTGSTAYNGVPDDDNLYVFSITQSGTNAGALTQVTKQPTTYSPFSIAVQSNTGGDLVYSFSFNDAGTALNPIEGFSISATGTLTKDAASPFNLPTAEGTWGQFDQSGAYLFSYASYTNASDTVVTQLAPITVGTGGALTQPITTLSLKTPGFWVVTDPQ